MAWLFLIPQTVRYASVAILAITYSNFPLLHPFVAVDSGVKDRVINNVTERRIKPRPLARDSHVKIRRKMNF